MAGIVESILDAHQPPVEAGITLASHAALDQAMNQARTAIRQGGAPSSYAAGSAMA